MDKIAGAASSSLERVIVTVEEVSESGSVPNLLVENKGEIRILPSEQAHKQKTKRNPRNTQSESKQQPKTQPFGIAD